MTKRRYCMSVVGHPCDVLVLGSGTRGRLAAWTMAKEGKRTAVVERGYIGGFSSTNIACLPSKNVIHTTRVASLVGRHQEFGLCTGSVVVHMAGVYAHKRKMVDEIVKVHLHRHHAAGDELILGEGKFVGPHTLQVALREGGERALTAERVFLNVRTIASIPAVPGMADSRPLTHEALDLERVPEHLIVVGGGYVRLELSLALPRLGSRCDSDREESTTAVTRGSGCGGSHSGALPG